jgi:4-hydroxy-tetrahydrodipicolinate reductase
MGREVERVARERGHEIHAVFDVDAPVGSPEELAGARALIDFSLAGAVEPVLRAAAAAGIPVVEGTTGWYDQFETLRKIPGLTMVYSPNFSVGVYQFMRLVKTAGTLLGRLDYDAYVHEWHHSGKADSPGGTAKKLGTLLLDVLPGKTRMLGESCDRRIEPEELHVTSTRVGRIPGTHQVGFDSESDSITLVHQAHGREGFARGAVLAAEWIAGKSGIFTMDDFMSGLSREEE